MISKHISCKPKNDNYRRLAKYIADARSNGEKCLLTWSKGVWNIDDYDFAIHEVEDTQSLNSKTTKAKTYHLVLSFRIEDEGILTEKDFKSIEESFAYALGFSEHQRHCGVHKNTENIHMHIAYNMIHPVKLTRHEPYRDYYLLANTCREIEQKYTLSVDNGIDTVKRKHKVSARSATKESLTGEESFERFVMDKHDEIIDKIQKITTWEQIHKVFVYYGLELKQRGNGLIIKNLKGKQSIKVSLFDREISYKKLVVRLGYFYPSKQTYQSKIWYKKRPLYVDPSNKLWQEFIKESRAIEVNTIKERWYQEKIRITGLAVSRQSQFDLLKRARKQERLEINELYRQYEIKTSSWLDFLQGKALEGDEEALKFLRKDSQTQEESSKAKNNTPQKIKQKAFGNFEQSLIKQKEVYENEITILSSNTYHETKKVLMVVNRMQSIADDMGENFSYRITRTGAIVFEFENGAKIVDEKGRVSANEKGEEIAKGYMQNNFCRAKPPKNYRDSSSIQFF